MALAEALLARGLARDADAVLRAAAVADPARRETRAWRTMMAISAARLGRFAEARALADAPDACPAGLVAADGLGEWDTAVSLWPCAARRLAGAPAAWRSRVTRHAAHAHWRAGDLATAARFAPALVMGDAHARLLATRLLRAAGDAPAAARIAATLARHPPFATHVRLDAAAALAVDDPARARTLLATERWVERDATTTPRRLLLGFRTADALGQRREALAAAAALLRFNAERAPPAALGAVAARASAILVEALDDPGLPARAAATLFWDHRDLVAPGAAGDAAALLLSGRLERAGHHERAAGILLHLARRDHGTAAAAYRIGAAANQLRAGDPKAAAATLEAARADGLPADLARRRDALAGLAAGRAEPFDSAPPALRFAAAWRAGDWGRALAAAEPALAERPRFDDLAASIALKALAAAILAGDEAAAAALRRDWGARLMRSRWSGAYALLTRPPASAPVAAALLALPAHPASDLRALTDATLAFTATADTE